MDLETLIGIKTDHLEEFENNSQVYLFEKNTLNKFKILKTCFENDYPQHQIYLVSTYRNFNSQLKIWNEKAQGKRNVLDQDEKIVDISLYSDKEKYNLITKFSAIPGLSRHHWGTDFDFIDGSIFIKDSNFQLQLTNTEHDQYFKDFHQCLSPYLKKYGFYHPYNNEEQLVSWPYHIVENEPWHISHQNSAMEFEKELVKMKNELIEFYQTKRNEIELSQIIISELIQNL